MRRGSWWVLLVAVLVGGMQCMPSLRMVGWGTVVVLEEGREDKTPF